MKGVTRRSRPIFPHVVDREGENVLVVRAFDPTDPDLPTGKQVGWYTPSSGIWQTVWLEARPKTYISGFRIVATNPPGRGSLHGRGRRPATRRNIQLGLGRKTATVEHGDDHFEPGLPRRPAR